jgi:hypothetical protein
MKSPIEVGTGLGSSLSSNNELTLSEYKEKIILLVEPILLRRFPDQYSKQKARTYRDRVSIACPYCGDSTKFPHKKRGNFILEGKHQNFYKCFNCDMFKRTDQFFKDYHTEIDLNVLDYIVDHQGDFSTRTRAKYDASIIMDVDLIESYALDREEVKAKLNLVEIKGSNVEPWLRRRLQFRNEFLLYNPSKNYLAILNTTQEGKILGLQKRALGKVKGWQEKYLTYKLSKLYKGFKPNEEVPDEIDSLSQIFGIFHLNFNAPITLFEGPLDSFLYKNSIASAGANKALPFDIGVRYWMDYDKTGIKKSIQYIEDEQYVFLWEKLNQDINFPYRKKWDLNDLFIWIKENNMKVPLFDQYFSNDSLDLIDL